MENFRSPLSVRHQYPLSRYNNDNFTNGQRFGRAKKNFNDILIIHCFRLSSFPCFKYLLFYKTVHPLMGTAENDELILMRMLQFGFFSLLNCCNDVVLFISFSFNISLYNDTF